MTEKVSLTNDEIEKLMEEADHDGVLVSYIQATESLHTKHKAEGKPTEGGLTLTLMVNGAIVTGTLTSHAKWEAETDALIRKAFGSDEGEDVAEEAPEVVQHVEPWDRRHIHLVDAQFGLGDQLMPTDRGVPWRGRLRHVSGWSLGKASVTRS